MSATNPSHALGLVLVDELARLGLRHAVLSPGSRSAPVALALAGEERVRLHVRIDERSAAFTALGIARASGAPAAVLSTSGTAAANFLPAVIEASLDRIPLLVLTADRPPELRGTGANQTIDQVKLYGDAVRWFCEVGVPEDVPGIPRYWRSIAGRAWAEATASPPGPVHLNLPLREPLVPSEGVFAAPLEGRSGGEPWTRPVPGVRGPSPEAVALLTQRVQAAERGVIVAGAGPAGTTSAILDFARRAGYPLIAEPASGLRRGPLAISTAEALLRAGFGTDHRPDLVLRMGKTGLSRAQAAWLDGGVPQIVLDRDAAWLDPERRAEHLVIADPAAALAAVPVERGDSTWSRTWTEAEARVRWALDEVLDESGLSEPRVARDLAAGLPDGTLLVVAASMPVRDLDWFMAPRAGLAVTGNRGANGIDGVVSTAVGAASVHQGPTAALLGDLALLHDGNGLLLPPGERADIRLVVLNNDGGGIFSFLPQAAHPHFEDLFGTPHGRDLSHLAALHHLDHLVLGAPEHLEEATRRPGIVEVRTDRAVNVDVHRACWEAARRAL